MLIIRYLTFIVRRLALLAFVLAGLSVITFVLARIVPSDPAATYLGPHARPEQVEAIRAKLGLDRPLFLQYAYYIRDIAHGDLGTSISTHQPVLKSVLEFLPASLELMCAAMLIAIVVGVALGTMSARREGSLVDHMGRLLSLCGVSLPAFWLGLLLQIVFFRSLGILPLGGRLDTIMELMRPVPRVTGFMLIDALVSANWPAWLDAAAHMVLPALTLAAYSTGIIARMTRASMLDVVREDYITAARAQGIPEGRVYASSALKNALGPTLTTAGLAFASMLTGTFYIETIFYWPGLGTYTANAILSLDYPVIMGVTLIGAMFYVLVNLVVDIIISLIDPRIGI